MKKDWNFDEMIDRSHTGSMKWEPEVLNRVFGKGKEGLLPLWVADMDFKCPTPIRMAMENRISHQIYGYSITDPSYYSALISWYERRHQWSMAKDWILTTPGVVPAITYMIQCFTNPGDKVLIQSPVYYPFARSILNNGRQIQDNPLQIIDGQYEMDFDDLEIKAKDPRVKLAILCSPHNPVGRVWKRGELEMFGKICIENNILIISDEIHCDLIMPGHKHTCFPTLSEEFAQNSITGIAASKTFNLAGLQQSSIIIPNPDIRARLFTHLENLGFINGVGGTLFGAIAATAAYNEAEEWLDDLLIYLNDNFNFLKTTLEQSLSGVKVFDLEGTYLAWADFKELGHDNETQIRLLEETAKVGLDHGNWFGDNGTGFERFNIACPRTILEKAVSSVIAAFK
ncbi:MAG: pyridoxal phosphate-dependent aminotransferase [Desulfobacteraceae bacterium]|nr:pyridoxal phosphate-dependent aminotransferase [Desulfobacteraceae bacterium]